MADSGLTLTIERMAYGADAVAHADDGKTVFVQGGVPGDVVRAEVFQDGPSFSKARVTEVIEASDARVRPECPLSGVCGGCPWASMRYDAQAKAKRANVVDSLVRIGHMDAGRVEKIVAPCESPSKPWGYRNKIELACASNHGRVTIGMHGVDPSQVVKVTKCPLLDARDAGLAKSVSGAVSYLANSHHLQIDRIGIRTSRRTHDVEVALWTQPGPFPRAQAAKIINDATRATSVVRVLTKGPLKARKFAGQEVLGGRGHWSEKVGEETMRVSAPSFFQVNTRGAERLVQLVMDGLGVTEDDEAMDLYCGAGTFTLPLARAAGFVSAVESYGPAVRDLRRNLDWSRVQNVDAIGGDADLEFPDTDADVIVVDPPRAGLAESVVGKLSDQPARAIAYVSCDPATLGRDLGRFEAEGTFRVRSVTPVDLFPQTFHVETVTILERA